MKECPKWNEDDLENNCEKQCDVVYEKYPYLLYDNYKDRPQKLDEVCENAPSFTKKKREFTKSIWWKIFEWRPEIANDEKQFKKDNTN